MTESLYHATDDLILPTPRKYYQAKIDTSHWQLRSLISSPEQDVVYFPTGTDIIAINSKTREREVVASLTFLPRCLVASKDWLCCGGESGNFAVISLKGRLTELDAPSLPDADPDSRLPLDLDPTRRSSNIGAMIDSYRSIRGRTMTTHSEKVGTEIINSITLWSPSDGLSERVYKVPVAVVSNNDCTVSILNVATADTLETLKMPDFVNRSAISPDGEMLVAICDDPFLYIHKRRTKAEPKSERFESMRSPIYEWVLAERIQLDSQRKADKTQMRGSFALSFSRSGKYLAIASQYGVFSVFDAECLTDMGSLMVSFTCSRPGQQIGAVRAMEFSPGPFDLLAWTEASGRVGIADVRTLFNSRQIIPIFFSEAYVERVALSDRSAHRSVLRNLESPPSSAPDQFGAELERQSLALARGREPPTPYYERHLEVSGIARWRERDSANAAGEIFDEESVISRRGPWAQGQRTTPANGESRASRLVSNSGLPTAAHDRSAASFRAFMDERNLDSARRTQLLEEEARRESSLLLAVEDAVRRVNLRTEQFTESLNSLDRPSLTPGQRDSPTDYGVAPESNTPWTDIQSVYRAAQQAAAPNPRSTRLRVQVGAGDDGQNMTVNQREFGRRLRQPWGPTEGPGAWPRDQMLDGRLRAAETMGCCWSPDGRILYAATLEGIHEYHVNIAGRRRFPSLVLR